MFTSQNAENRKTSHVFDFRLNRAFDFEALPVEESSMKAFIKCFVLQIKKKLQLKLHMQDTTHFMIAFNTTQSPPETRIATRSYKERIFDIIKFTYRCACKDSE